MAIFILISQKIPILNFGLRKKYLLKIWTTKDALIFLDGCPEGGARCLACFALRLGETARQARAHGFEYFTTTLSVSPHKNAENLNRIGEAVGKEEGVKYLMADFKKKNGYLRSLQLSKEFDLYRQDYCGCQYSRAAKNQA